MLIGIDGFELSESRRAGAGRLAVELIKSLAKVDRKNSYRIYVPFKKPVNKPLQMPDVCKTMFAGQNSKWEYRHTGFNRLWSQATLPFYLYKDKPYPDVFLTLSHYIPRFCPCPSANFVFDLSYLRFPNMFKKRDLYKLKNWTAYSVRKAAKVITISKASKADIIHFYNLDSGKIKVVYPGVFMKVKSASKKLKVKYGIAGEYILYVGTLQPRKNLVRLIEAFNKLKSQNSKLKSTSKKLKLVIVGRKGWLYENIFKKVEDLNLTQDVVFTGFVPDEELPAFYEGAKCLVLVSLYEGFGLPVLEAMSYGTPVVISNVSSLPEVAGEAGIYVDPNDTSDIANGILKILKKPNREYKKLSEKCENQAKKFSWEKTANEVLKVLEDIVRKEK